MYGLTAQRRVDLYLVGQLVVLVHRHQRDVIEFERTIAVYTGERAARHVHFNLQ